MVPFSRLLEALRLIADPRRPQGRRYPLPHLLLFSVLAILSGANSYRTIRIFIRERNEVLAQSFGLGLRTVPAVNTLRTVLQALKAEDLENAFRQHAQALLPSAPEPEAATTEPKRRRVIALDGKALRHSFDHVTDQKAAQVLSAFACEHAIILAHMEVDDKSNEIPAAQELIKALGVKGVIFTADAMHCQKKHSSAPPIPAIS